MDQSQPDLACPSGYSNDDHDHGCLNTSCPANYYFDGGNTCYAPCPSGYIVDANANMRCVKYYGSGYPITKNTPRIMRSSVAVSTNFIDYSSSSISCPSGFSKEFTVITSTGEHFMSTQPPVYCIRDCSTVGLMNCAVSYCAASADQCNSGTLDIFVNFLISAAGVFFDLLTLGESSSGFNAAKKSLLSTAAQVGKETMTASFSVLKTVFGNPRLYQNLKNIVIQNSIKYLAGKVGNGVVTDVCSTISDYLAGSFASKSSPSDVSTSSGMFDFMQSSPILQNCGIGGNSSGCTQALLNGLGNFDPTGILSLVATFIQPTCALI